jgi:hypothetical protein
MLYSIYSGTGDYKHVMFTTTDKAAADAFVADFNRQFDPDDFDTYGAYRAYIEEIDDFVPNLYGSKYMNGNAVVYTVKIYSEVGNDYSFGVIKPAEIFGLPLFDYIDDTHFMYKGFFTSDKLQDMLDTGYYVDFDCAYSYEAVVHIISVEQGKYPDYNIVHNSDIPGDVLENLVHRAYELYKEAKKNQE